MKLWNIKARCAAPLPRPGRSYHVPRTVPIPRQYNGIKMTFLSAQAGKKNDERIIILYTSLSAGGGGDRGSRNIARIVKIGTCNVYVSGLFRISCSIPREEEEATFISFHVGFVREGRKIARKCGSCCKKWGEIKNSAHLCKWVRAAFVRCWTRIARVVLLF